MENINLGDRGDILKYIMFDKLTTVPLGINLFEECYAGDLFQTTRYEEIWLFEILKNHQVDQMLIDLPVKE